MNESVTGYIDHVIFRNEENGYTVMILKGVDGEEELTCVGTFPVLTMGASVELTGSYIQHPVYGKQFQVSVLTEKMPEDAMAMERYLGSGAIKGIGAALAARIVRRFGKDTLHIVEEEPERLAEVKGISEKKAREIAMQVAEKADMRKAMMFLQKYGISLNLGARIYQKYGETVYSVLQENPYRLADISGIGFKIADEIAYRIGIHTDSDYRIRSGMMYTLLQASRDGHVYLPKEELFQKSSELLGVDSSYMEKHLMDLSVDRKLVQKEKDGEILVYPTLYYYLELNTARMLKELDILYPEEPEMMNKQILQIEKETETVLDEMQKKAVTEAACHGLFILTGGPGTGKTTTINAIIRYFEGQGAEIRLAAPTGRAAKRMTEATGYEAQTIHRLLELTGMPEDNDQNAQAVHFERNAENPLEADVIIIDEMSMVDIQLMHSLLQAVIAGTRLILVGDENQLPSVGPGNVLHDIIQSQAFPVIELTKIFRQASESDIVVNAHKINRGEQILLNNKSRDFFFLKRYDADIIIRVVIALIQEKLPRYVEAKPFDIQVLTPMRKGLLGVERLNQILQRYLNPPDAAKKERESMHGLLREGDKVMQIRNNYQMEWEIRGRYGIPIEKGIGIFNGDTGILRTINEFAETAEVEFEDGRWAEYSFKQLEELELAYAITIHKSQGSEYPAVVIPILSGPKMLLNRNLLYTAVTRARKCVTVVGSEETLREMIRNEKQQQRYSSLDQRICEMEE